MPQLLLEEIDFLHNGELLRRPVMWRERRRLLLDQLSSNHFRELCALRHPPSGCAEVINAAMVLAGKHRQPKDLTNWDRARAALEPLKRQPPSAWMLRVEPAAIEPPLVERCGQWLEEPWFDVERMNQRSFACGILVGWMSCALEAGRLRYQ